MKKVKLFAGRISNIGQEAKQFNPLQDAINEWLKNNPRIKVAHIALSSTPVNNAAEASFAVFYEEELGG